jgi:hypothetical protein
MRSRLTQHDAAVKGFAKADKAYPEWRIKEGKYGEAEQIAREIWTIATIKRHPRSNC